MENFVTREGAIFDIETLKANLEVDNYSMPFLTSANELPERLVSLTNIYKPDTDKSWLHFYLDDSRFECVWNNPYHYLSTFRKVKGVISPDFSVYRNMPSELQRRNVYRNRAIAVWLNSIGVKVIPNIRWGDTNTYKMCFSGIEEGSVVAVSNYGCYAKSYDRQKFKEGLYCLIDYIHPSGIVLYGTLPDYLEEECKKLGVELRYFRSDFDLSRRKECA